MAHTVSTVTSGPPYVSRSIRYSAAYSGSSINSGKQPGSNCFTLLFISPDRVRILQSQADIIEAIQQAVLTERINLKGVFFAIRAANHLRFQVHGQLIAFVGFHRLEQLINALLIQHDRQQAVLEAVIEENVGVAWRDNGTETEVFQRPGRVFTAGAATKVFARQQHRGALITRPIQYEIGVQRTTGVIRIRLTFVQITQLIKQVRAEA